MHNFFFEFNL